MPATVATFQRGERESDWERAQRVIRLTPGTWYLHRSETVVDSMHGEGVKRSTMTKGVIWQIRTSALKQLSSLIKSAVTKHRRHMDLLFFPPNNVLFFFFFFSSLFFLYECWIILFFKTEYWFSSIVHPHTFTHAPFINIYIYIYIYIYIHTYTHVDVHTCMHAYLHIYTHIHVCINTHIHIHTCACIHAYIHRYIYIYMHMCMFIYIHTYMYAHI